MTDAQIDDLRRRVARLQKILDDDEPGLMVWNQCVNAAWLEVVKWAPKHVLEARVSEL